MKEFQFEIVSRRIAELLKKKCPEKTHEEISKETGISPSVLSKMKLGVGKTPSCETIFKFAAAFNVSADWLLGLSDCKTTDKATQETCKALGLSDNTLTYLMEHADRGSRVHTFIEQVVSNRNNAIYLNDFMLFIDLLLKGETKTK